MISLVEKDWRKASARAEVMHASEPMIFLNSVQIKSTPTAAYAPQVVAPCLGRQLSLGIAGKLRKSHRGDVARPDRQGEYFDIDPYWTF